MSPFLPRERPGTYSCEGKLMKDWLYPGAKVVCVNPCNDLRHGQIYTVTRVEAVCGSTMIDVAESTGWSKHTPAFFARRFRPLTKRSTDAEVSKLKRLLNTTPADLETV